MTRSYESRAKGLSENLVDRSRPLRRRLRRPHGFVASSLLLAVALLAPVAASAQNDPYQQGLAALRARNLPEAAKLFYFALTTAQGDVKAKAEFGLADTLRKMNLNYGSAFFFSRIVAQGPKNDLFRPALEALSAINAETPLGRASIDGLFAAQINPLAVPPQARGFYFFYKGLEAFDAKRVGQAKAEFDRVPEGSPYYAKAQYYRGVIQALGKESDGALAAFAHVSRQAGRDGDKGVQELARMNIGRIYYEKREFRKALEFYSRIPRNSDLWLQSLLEGSWTFFLMQKHNNTLGNIHTIQSPFFVNRFYPESYILSAITYLYLCRFDRVDLQLKRFQERYRPTFSDLRGLLTKYQRQPRAMFNLIVSYRANGSMREFGGSTEVIDSISRSEAFREANSVVRGLERERSALSPFAGKWESAGLAGVLKDSFEKRKAATIDRAGEDLYEQAQQQLRQLKELSDQTRLINLQRSTTEVEQIRAAFNNETVKDDGGIWGEGMKPLSLKSELEYWPFEGEYWEDELGGYVYNIDSRCGAGKGKGK